jgi:hypothetical protein
MDPRRHAASSPSSSRGLEFVRTTTALLRHESRAANSHAADKTTWNNWSRYCLRFDLPLWISPCTVGSPIWYDQSEQLENFVAVLFRSHDISADSIATYMSNLGAIHSQRFGRNTLKDYEAYNAGIKGVRRIQSLQGRKRNVKDPFTIAMYKRATATADLTSVYDRTHDTATIMGLSFLLRVSELIPCKRSRHHLRWRDVSISRNPDGSPTALTIRIPHSKMDFRMVTRTLPLSTDAATCAVRAADRYIRSFGPNTPARADPFFQTPELVGVSFPQWLVLR